MKYKRYTNKKLKEIAESFSSGDWKAEEIMNVIRQAKRGNALYKAICCMNCNDEFLDDLAYYDPVKYKFLIEDNGDSQND